MPNLRLPDLSGQGKPLRWLLLFLLTAAFASLLSRASLPAANLLGAMAAAIFLAVSGGEVRVPRPVSYFSQSIVGCMISRSISMEILMDIRKSWPLFLLMVMSVSLIATTLGWLLARAQVLPGSTAIWGTSPGAALVMTLMSEGFGADSRLVAFMQYTRVVLVSIVATVLASIWGVPKGAMPIAAVSAVDVAGLFQTLALAATGMLAGVVFKIPAGPMLVPLILGSLLNVYGVIHIELPWWLLVCAYSLVGWTVGLRFTREIVKYAFRAFPKILASMLTMIFLCGVLALIIGHYAGLDPMSVYLATSPGGMDSVAIIAASIGGDMSFVMAVQTTRFLIVSTTSPAIATFVAKRTGMAGQPSQKK